MVSALAFSALVLEVMGSITTAGDENLQCLNMLSSVSFAGSFTVLTSLCKVVPDNKF